MRPRPPAKPGGAFRGGPRRPAGPPPFGRPPQLVSGRQDIFGQLVDSSGSVVRADLGEAVPALVTPEVREVAAGAREAVSATARSGGVPGRGSVTPLRSNLAHARARGLQAAGGRA